MKKRKDIETFRGFACLIIVAFHFGTAMEEFNLISKNIFCLGNYAVDFFFILSAYFLWGKSKNNKGINLFKYRLIRLYPAYWLSVLETSIFLYSVNSKQLPSLKEILFNMTMLQNLWGGAKC